jgi:hypothetical protein
MAQNRAHNSEPQAQRLARLQSNPIEAIETLLYSIDNYFNNEIRITPDYVQTSLLFLGIHAAALTIGEVFFDNDPLNNYSDFLKIFVDGQTQDMQFSIVADEIHNWRNILAHQWLGSSGHKIEYDYSATLGWEKRGDVLVINPKIYCDKYLEAFAAGGRIWGYDAIFTPQQLTDIHVRIVNKYVRK